ncbi:MAG: hypothetical protein HZA31_01565 [Opitutae bacterium]|nr:hypothetical protein [Opitutae bacterium]
MNAARYQELLGRLLEQELTESEAAELARGLTAQPGLQTDLQRHLVLWEIWSQHASPERSAEAFVAAWATRLRAENEGADPFWQAVQARLADRRRWFWPGWRATLWATSAVAAGLAVALWLVVPRAAQAMVTVQGEAVCTVCILHESGAHLPAVRVRAEGKPAVYYLQPTPELHALQDRFCNGPAPITVDGTTQTQAGRTTLHPHHFELRPPPPPPPASERVLFPL